jgi:hypothetical protein
VEPILLLGAIFGIPYMANSKGFIKRLWVFFTVFLIAGLVYCYRVDRLYHRNSDILSFQMLGLRRDFNSFDFKKVKKEVYLNFHPDRSPDSEKAGAMEKFLKLDQILTNLSHPVKRELIDKFGSANFNDNTENE